MLRSTSDLAAKLLLGRGLANLEVIYDTFKVKVPDARVRKVSVGPGKRPTAKWTALFWSLA